MLDEAIKAWHIPLNRGALQARTTKGALAAAFLEASPSAKIRYAIADLEAAERSTDYTIDMATWHIPDRFDNRCHVCLAGAVLANRHRIEAHQIYVGPLPADGPGEFSLNGPWADLFSALDEFRSGYVEAFLTVEGSLPDDKVVAFSTAQSPGDPFGRFPGHIDYEHDPAAFKTWALRIADKLEATGF